MASLNITDEVNEVTPASHRQRQMGWEIGLDRDLTDWNGLIVEL